jgi:Cysteine rich repeat
MRRNFVIAAALLLALTPALAQQQAPVPQQPAGNAFGPSSKASPEVKAARQAMRQACVEDARSLCAGSQPGGGKIMMCLRAHKDQVSDGCKAAAQHLRDVRRGA